MSSRKRAMHSPALEVRFVGDADVFEHIIDKQEGKLVSYLITI